MECATCGKNAPPEVEIIMNAQWTRIEGGKVLTPGIWFCNKTCHDMWHKDTYA